MRIDKLRLANFRCFERFEIELHERCTVLAGVNGSGKSSVLEGLAVAAGAWFVGFDIPPPRGIRRDEARRDFIHEGQQANVEPVFPVRVEAWGSVGDPDDAAVERAIQWARDLRTAKGNTTTTEMAELRALAEAYQDRVKRPNGRAPVDLPVIAYYGAGRLWSQKRASAKKEEGLGSRTEGYQDCLDPESNHKLFSAWMRLQEFARIQRIAETFADGRRAVHGPDDLLRPDHLAAVEDAAVALIEGAYRLTYDAAYQQLRVTFHDQRRVPFDLLSDGFRSLVALAADIAWRAVRLNPHQRNEAPVLARGIVLIDEVELHLHPGWQRTVLPRLTEAFPNLQFVVTTHSPQVIASVPAEQVRFLDDQGRVHAVGAAEGLDSNYILKKLMGVPERPVEVVERLNRLGILIDEGKATEARALVDKLRETLPEDDPELEPLMWELRTLEVGGAAD